MSAPSRHSRRPRLLSFLAILFWMMSVSGWLRAYGAISEWGLLTQLHLSVAPLYLVLSGVAWGLVGLAAGVVIWAGRVWPPIFAAIAALFYPVTYWADRLLFSAPGSGGANLPFALGVTLIWIAFAAGTLFGKAARRYFFTNEASHPVPTGTEHAWKRTGAPVHPEGAGKGPLS